MEQRNMDKKKETKLSSFLSNRIGRKKRQEERNNEGRKEGRTLTPCSRVLLEKLTVPQLVKKFPTFYGTRRFITTFTTARQWSLS